MGYFLLSIFVMGVGPFSFSEAQWLLQHSAALCKLFKSSERKKSYLYHTNSKVKSERSFHVLKTLR